MRKRKNSSERSVWIPQQHGFNAPHLHRLAGMVQLCRPNWSVTSACRAAQQLIGIGIAEFRGTGSLADYLVYLELLLARYARPMYGESQSKMDCEREVKAWAEHWLECWGLD